jgi:RNA polymerase sigma-70 factor (ECF subfamily)
MIANDAFLETLFIDNHTYIRAIVTRIIRDKHQAEDIVNDAFVEAIKSVEIVRNHPCPQGWLVVTARNICRHYYRDTQKQNKLIDALKTSKKEYYDRYEDPVDLFSGLKAADREILVMYYLEDKSTSEIAKVLEIKESTARSRLSRARNRIKPQLRMENILLIFIIVCNNLSSDWH